MRRDSVWKSSVFRTILASLCGMIPMAGIAALLTILLLFMNVPERFLILAADVIWCIGAFTAGRISGKHARLHGIRIGLLCGLFLCCILLAACVCMDAAITARVWIRCAAVLPSGVCGGICGVNTKINKPPY